MKKLLSVSEARKIQDAGLDLIMASIPDARTGDERVDALVTFKEFRDRLAWARVEGDLFLTDESKSGVQAYRCILPPEHPRAVNGPLYAVPTAIPSNIVTIRPIQITTEWAGIGQLHEMVHLIDRAYGIEPMRPNPAQYYAGEGRAYTIENTGVNQLTQGKFQADIERVLQEEGLKKPDHLIHALQDRNRAKVFFQALSEGPDRTINSTSPLNEAEGAMRRAFGVMSAGITLIDGQKQGKAKWNLPNFIAIVTGMGQLQANRPNLKL